MAEQLQDQLRQWIQDAAARTQPIQFDEVTSRPRLDTGTPSLNGRGPSTILIEEFETREPTKMDKTRTLLLVGVAALVVAISALAIRNSTDTDAEGTDIAADRAETTGSTPPISETTAVDPPPTTADQTPVERATAFWEALAAGDRDATLAMVDPATLDSPGQGASPFGRAHTLSGQFDWYEAVDWQWEFRGCVEWVGTAAECSAMARNAWSDALGIDPIPGTFIVRLSDDGITENADKYNEFRDTWLTQAFEVFRAWVVENHPDDAETMFDFDLDVNREILSLYETNTARFVEAQNEN